MQVLSAHHLVGTKGVLLGTASMDKHVIKFLC